jgi:hypothetical protein
MNSPTNAIRAKVSENALPRTLPKSMTSGGGGGQPCSGCGALIQPARPRYALDFGGGQIFRFHAECEQIWRRETGN